MKHDTLPEASESEVVPMQYPSLQAHTDRVPSETVLAFVHVLLR